VNFAEKRFDATGADAGPNEGDLADFEECIAAVAMNRPLATENGADGVFEFLQIFAATKNGVRLKQAGR
jgi:hypothetical protein